MSHVLSLQVEVLVSKSFPLAFGHDLQNRQWIEQEEVSAAIPAVKDDKPEKSEANEENEEKKIAISNGQSKTPKACDGFEDSDVKEEASVENSENGAKKSKKKRKRKRKKSGERHHHQQHQDSDPMSVLIFLACHL